jgi:hypothetical protein
MATLPHQEQSTALLATAEIPVRPLKPEFIRLPSPKARCPYTGLSRSTVAELCVPCVANGFNPPVKSAVIRKRGAIRGIRLIDYNSLMSYIISLPNTGAEERGSKT